MVDPLPHYITFNNSNKENTMTTGYAVLVEYWNGSGYSVNGDDTIYVYSDKVTAEKDAQIIKNTYGADVDVTVMKVRVR